MKHLNTICILLLSALFIASCDRPDCENTNPVFDDNSPDSRVYKNELVSQLKSLDEGKLTFWLKSYEEINGSEYLYFYVQGDGLCAVMEMTMENWDGLELVREKKGVSYRGAEFRGLKYEVKLSDEETQFIYRSHDRIID